MAQNRARANITLPKSLKDRAKASGNLSKTIEDALHAYLKETTIHYVNTNAQHVPGDGSTIYGSGVVATYGDQKFGETLRDLKPGDGVISYVSTSYVDYDGGARAFGVVQAPWSGKPVESCERVYPGNNDVDEYHVPIKWLGVLSETATVSTEDIRTITGRKTPQRTLETPASDYQHGMQLLAQVILGRTILTDLL